MFVLKRAAARAASTCPVQQISSVRRAPFRLCTSQRGNPTLLRSFHQSRRCLVDEQKQQASPAQAETSGETVTTEPSITEQEKEVKEKSIATADVLENPEVQNAQQTAENAKATVSSTVDQVKEFASSAAETVQQAASGAAQTATQSFPTQRSPRRETRPGKILYVGNLFFEVTAPQLEAEFAKHGEISNTRVVTDDRGLSKGFAYVEFATQESADRAIRQLDQAVFQGRRMAVQYHIPRGKAPRARDAEVMPPSKTLFIGNMSYQMSDRDLNDLFREIRNVLDVRVAIDRRSGQPRGFAHADFVDVQSATTAKEHLEKKVVYGRQLRVGYSKSSSQRTHGSSE